MGLRCDATGDRMSRADNPTGDCSVFVRFRATDLSNLFRLIFYAGDSAGGTYENGIMIFTGEAGDQVEIWLRSVALRFQQATTIVVNQWYDLACEYSTVASQAARVYIWAHGSATDLGDSFTGGSSGTAVSERLEFGNDPTGDNGGAIRIADGRVWNARLTEAEFIRERWSKGRAVRRLNLWSEYSLQNDSIGLTDTSGNGRNLTEAGTLTVEDDPLGIPMNLYRPVFFGASGEVAPPAGVYLRSPFANVFTSRVLS